MARSSRSGGGSRPSRAGAPISKRPTVPASKPAPVQTRPASTAAMPSSQYGRPSGPPAAPGQHNQNSGVPAVPQTGGGGGGMLSNIVSTGMGVALGHQISNGISSMFGGGSAEPPAAAAPPAQDVASQGVAQNSWGQAPCETDVKTFTKCMTDHNGNMDICGWYLSQLKACQQAAKEY